MKRAVKYIDDSEWKSIVFGVVEAWKDRKPTLSMDGSHKAEVLADVIDRRFSDYVHYLLRGDQSLGYAGGLTCALMQPSVQEIARKALLAASDRSETETRRFWTQIEQAIQFYIDHKLLVMPFNRYGLLKSHPGACISHTFPRGFVWEGRKYFLSAENYESYETPFVLFYSSMQTETSCIGIDLENARIMQMLLHTFPFVLMCIINDYRDPRALEIEPSRT
jgi:hypothetical protein